MTSPPPLGQQSNGLATCSLVCGICGFITGPLTGIVAIITGFAAKGKIRTSGGLVGGAGASTAGLILGWVTTIVPILFIGLAVLATPQIRKALVRAKMAENMRDGKTIKSALDFYATDHDGRYPPTLNDLVLGKYLDEPEVLEYRNVEGTGRREWLYFPGQFDTDNSTNILLATPEPFSWRGNQARIVLRIDNSATTITESDFVKQLEAQGVPVP